MAKTRAHRQRRPEIKDGTLSKRPNVVEIFVIEPSGEVGFIGAGLPDDPSRNTFYREVFKGSAVWAEGDFVDDGDPSAFETISPFRLEVGSAREAKFKTVTLVMAADALLRAHQFEPNLKATEANVAARVRRGLPLGRCLAEPVLLGPVCIEAPAKWHPLSITGLSKGEVNAALSHVPDLEGDVVFDWGQSGSHKIFTREKSMVTMLALALKLPV